jgi:hypothetical protein
MPLILQPLTYTLSAQKHAVMRPYLPKNHPLVLPNATSRLGLPLCLGPRLTIACMLRIYVQNSSWVTFSVLLPKISIANSGRSISEHITQANPPQYDRNRRSSRYTILHKWVLDIFQERGWSSDASQSRVFRCSYTIISWPGIQRFSTSGGAPVLFYSSNSPLKVGHSRTSSLWIKASFFTSRYIGLAAQM